MDKKGQIPPQLLAIGGVILFLLIALPIFSQVMDSISCQNEKGQIAKLQNMLSSCESLNSWLRNTLQDCQSNLNSSERNCLNRLNKSYIDCDKRIQNITQNCINYNLYINKTVNFLWIYTLQLIVFIPLTISLFKFVFSPKLSKKQEKIWNFIKFLIIIIWLIILIWYVNDFLNSIRVFFIR